MTTFALIATYQVWENYGAHAWDGEGECPQYWKAKGSEEVVVAENLSLGDVTEKGHAGLNALVMAKAPENDEYYMHDLIDWELVKLSDDLLEKVKKMNEDKSYHDPVWLSIKLGITEYAAKWALGRI